MNFPSTTIKLNYTKICIILLYLTIGNVNGDSDLWCYRCNTDLREGRKSECNDPYAPAPSADLVACPRNDSYVCLKSLIFYNNVHMTVRGCVPSAQKSTYCSFKEVYPEASLQCLFCSENGCNGAEKIATSMNRSFLVIFSISIFKISNLQIPP